VPLVHTVLAGELCFDSLSFPVIFNPSLSFPSISIHLDLLGRPIRIRNRLLPPVPSNLLHGGDTSKSAGSSGNTARLDV